MQITVSWFDDQHTILLYTFDPRWTWEDFIETKSVADPMIDAAGRDIALIFDARRIRHLPLNSLTYAREMVETRHPQGRPVIIVGENLIVRTIYHLVERVAGQFMRDFSVVESLDEAVAVIAHYREQSS